MYNRSMFERVTSLVGFIFSYSYYSLLWAASGVGLRSCLNIRRFSSYQQAKKM